MKRILVIGCCGSGKSTLAVKLGEALGLPVHHLDRLFWNPGWVPSSSEEFEAKLAQILNADEWIMDGNYGGSLAMRIDYADTIIFLDVSTLTCLAGALIRRWRFRGRSRPDMTEGNKERVNLEFLSWILNYRRSRRPRVLETLESLKNSKNVIILRSRSEIADFLNQLQMERQLT